MTAARRILPALAGSGATLVFGLLISNSAAAHGDRYDDGWDRGRSERGWDDRDHGGRGWSGREHGGSYGYGWHGRDHWYRRWHHGYGDRFYRHGWRHDHRHDDGYGHGGW
jgi:hypothetical protein